MSAIAIITARGGSKRIPKKNIKEFCGKPIIAYSIEAALKSGAFDTVMVSTDSEEIAEISKEYGAEVPFMRSQKTSDDFATTTDVLIEVIEEYQKRGKIFDTIACLYPTAPFITEEKLRDAMKLQNEDGVDSVISVVKYDFPPQRAFVISDGKVEYQYPENRNVRSQDLEPIYHDCGQFYMFEADKFLATHKMMQDNCRPYILKEEEVQDIDNESDWNMAEIKYQRIIEP